MADDKKTEPVFFDEAPFAQRLKAAIDERLRVIAGNEERLVEAWVAQHGWKPDETQIVRQDLGDGRMRMWVEKRGDFDELKRLREREPLVMDLALLAFGVQCVVRDAGAVESAAELDRLALAVRDFKI